MQKHKDWAKNESRFLSLIKARGGKIIDLKPINCSRSHKLN
jgi:hypothetical protein